MINQQLLLFIKQSLSQGSTKEKITSDLLSSGWTSSDIEEGFNSLNINTPSINNSEAKIPETQTQKIQTQASNSNNRGLKIFIVILALIALAVFGFIFYKGVIEKNKIKDSNLINQEQKQTVEQPNQEVQPEKVEAPVVTDTIPVEETNKVVATKTGPINCGKDMTCFMNAVKTCSPAFVEEVKTVDFFGMIMTAKTKATLSGFDSSKKCIYSSYVMDANLSQSPEMISFLKTEFEKQEGKTLTAEQEKELSVISPEAMAQAKSSIGITTKCTFTTTYLTGLYTKFIKGIFDSNDFVPGNCVLTDSSGKVMETMGTISSSSSSSNNTTSTSAATTKASNEIDLYLNKQTIFSNKNISSFDIGFTLLEVTDDPEDENSHIFKILVTKITTGEKQTITYYDDSFKFNTQNHVFGIIMKNTGYSYISGFLNNGVEETMASFQISKE